MPKLRKSGKTRAERSNEAWMLWAPLVDSVGNHRFLYATKRGNVKTRDEEWNLVLSGLKKSHPDFYGKKTVVELKSQWRKIRVRCRREWQARRSGHSSNSWGLFDHLGYLCDEFKREGGPVPRIPDEAPVSAEIRVRAWLESAAASGVGEATSVMEKTGTELEERNTLVTGELNSSSDELPGGEVAMDAGEIGSQIDGLSPSDADDAPAESEASISQVGGGRGRVLGQPRRLNFRSSVDDSEAEEDSEDEEDEPVRGSMEHIRTMCELLSQSLSRGPLDPIFLMGMVGLLGVLLLKKRRLRY